MPPFLLALLGGLINIAGTVAGRVMISLGFASITYTGVTVSLDYAKSQLIAAFAGLPAQVIGMLAIMNVGTVLSIVFSAVVARAVLNGLSAGGSISKLIRT